MAGNLRESGCQNSSTEDKSAQSPKSRLKSSLSVRVPEGRVFGPEHRMDRASSFNGAVPVLHSQVIKIREEEQQLIDEGIKINPKDRLAFFHLTSQMKDVVFVSKSRPFIPSPLGMTDRARPPVPAVGSDSHR